MTGTKRLYLYSVAERLWHWIQAAGILLLLLSGFQLHYPDRFAPFGDMRVAVYVHLALAALLMFNAFLGLFYQTATANIRQYIPMPVDFTRGMVLQLRYYLFGIMRGEPHPYEKSRELRLNPMQKLTYFLLLNFLMPFQIVTGLLLWLAEPLPGVVEMLGGLPVLGALHTAGAFLFLTFLLVHIYLTTTGHTVFAHIRAMISGYEDLPG